MSKSLTFTVFTSLTILSLLTGCSRRPTQVMALYDHIPSEVQKTTLLVEKFTHKSPVIYDSFYNIDTDSLKQVFKFTADPDAVVKPVDKPVRSNEHPLIVKTNKNLDSYNKRLEKAMRKYDYPYEIIDTASLDSGIYENLDKYRYVLYRRPVLHCFIDPEDRTRTSYRYTHYFHDRKTGQDFAPIEVFYPNPAKTVEAIVKRINELATSQNNKDYRPEE